MRYGSFDRSSFPSYWTKCQRCRAKVYFHQDENGGKVFFEHPGPPWPRHECGGLPLAIAVEPGLTSMRRVRGFLRERSLFPDPVRELEIPDTPIGRGVMVMLDLDPLARITIHEREPGRSADSSFTAWIPRRRLVLRPISVGEPVHATLQSKSVGDQLVWFCEALARRR